MLDIVSLFSKIKRDQKTFPDIKDDEGKDNPRSIALSVSVDFAAQLRSANQ